MVSLASFDGFASILRFAEFSSSPRYGLAVSEDFYCNHKRRDLVLELSFVFIPGNILGMEVGIASLPWLLVTMEFGVAVLPWQTSMMGEGDVPYFDRSFGDCRILYRAGGLFVILLRFSVMVNGSVGFCIGKEHY